MFDKKRLVLCADDFGLSRGVDSAILDLVERGRLSAVSCMVAGSDCAAGGAELARLADRTDIGLHLTLTDLAPLGPLPATMPGGVVPTIGTLIGKALAGRIAYAETKAEIGRQLARFTEIFGRPPDFVDGHQHCHVLPGIRRALIEEVAALTGRGHRMWLRSCAEPFTAIRRRGIEVPKTSFIAFLSRGMGDDARRAGAAANDSFRGVTSFAPEPSFRACMQRFLTGAGSVPLVMCHPAAGGHPADPTDAIMPARLREYAHLGSDAFPADLDAAGIRIGRFFDKG